MNSLAITRFHAAGSAFDTIAQEYDQVFTNSAIGRAQRDAVWHVAARAFSPASHILELNCGTGEDAFFLSRLGIKVYACDASENMIAVARKRQLREAPYSTVEFNVLATENLEVLDGLLQFDGVFSNFGGLNCLADMSEAGRHLAGLVRPGGVAVLCLCSRVCVWEIGWFLFHANFRRSFRRVKGRATATLNGVPVDLQYPTVREVCFAMRPGFVLRSVTAIGLAVPPTYLEAWARRHRKILGIMRSIDRAVADCPVLRVFGDHVLLVMERTQS
jgi:ubiquinone/menaquinone biosynthesis C-methylase UbiE